MYNTNTENQEPLSPLPGTIPTKDPKSSKKQAIVLIVSGLLLMAATGGWTLYKYLTTPFVNTDQESPATIQQRDTTNWKTYRNEEYGFELRYPRELFFTESLQHNYIAFYNEKPPEGTERPNLSIQISKNPENLSMKEFFDGKNEPDLFEQTMPEAIVPIKIDGVSGIKFDPYITFAGGEIIVIPLKLGFLMMHDDGGTFRSSGKLDQILSTFKFISTSTSPLSYEELVKSLPPDPGEAGKKTLEGIDSDNDGVRDDVQRIIYLKYKNSSKIIEAARDGAKALQAAILASQKPNNGGMSLTISSMERKSAQCILFIDPENASDIITEIDMAVLNTEARFNAYNLYESQVNGQSDSSTMPSPENRKFSCSFNPDLLPN